jgi:hypothetical protein
LVFMSSWNPSKTGPESSRRRSQRVIVSLAITIRTEDGSPGTSFEEKTQTLVLNAHGALIALGGKVEKGQTLRLINHATNEEQLCIVMYIGPETAGKAQVGLEFKNPSPDFWRITFPPENWKTPDRETHAQPEKKI